VKLRATAPGKLVLLGEYAVLFGHPALVAAVDRRAVVDVTPASDGQWSARAPGFADDPVDFEITGDRGVRWLDQPLRQPRLDLVGEVIAGLSGSRIDLVGTDAADIVLDTRQFFDGGSKLGLGSSAALTVALTEVLTRWGDADAPEDAVQQLDRLLDLHRRFQGGRGSGVDLAASLVGGVLAYRSDRAGGAASIEPVELPTGLWIVTVWTGRSASTPAFLERLDQEVQRGTGAVADALAEIGELAAAGIRELRTGDVSAFLARVDTFADAMESLGDSAGLDILSDAHRRLRTIGRDSGVRVKPSGAGGGDMAVGFTDDPEAAARFTDGAAAAGFTPLDLSLEPMGVQVSVHDSQFNIHNS